MEQIVVPDRAQAPKLTLPPQEAQALRKAYAGARTILEYGSGGSTVMASRMPRKTIFSVESDGAWMAGLAAWFAANPPVSQPLLHHCDLGETRAWGYPATNREWARFHHYPLAIWDHPDFVQPDVVLIDGRFRAGCFLTVLFRATRPMTVYFDDYTTRPAYHVVERYGAPAQIIGRMARFDIVPRPLPVTDLAWMMDLYTRKG